MTSSPSQLRSKRIGDQESGIRDSGFGKREAGSAKLKAES
jgi:hypothetical protein